MLRYLQMVLGVSLISFGFVSLGFPAHCRSDDPKAQWEDIFTSDGIQVSKTTIQDSKLFAFRGIGVIDAPITKVVAVLRDISRAKEWVDRASEIRAIQEIGPLERVEYYRIGLSWPVTDRDFVYHTKVEINKEAKQYIQTSISVEDPSTPARKGIVRGQIYKTRLVLTSIENGTKTHAIGEAHTDPKGALPTWLVNLVQKKWPYNTFMRVRQQVNKPDVGEDPIAKDLL